MDELLLHNFLSVTGWTKEKVLEQLKYIQCNYWVALDVFKAAGRLPDCNECDFINVAGFDAWFSLWQNGMTINNR